MIGRVFNVPNQLKEEIPYSFPFFYPKSDDVDFSDQCVCFMFEFWGQYLLI